MPTLDKLLDLLATKDDDAVGTSVRIPRNLRDAAQLAAELGLADTVTSLAISNLRTRLEGIAQLAVLEELYTEHPELRPTLAQVALGLAEMDGNPLADHPDLIERAAQHFAGRNLPAEPDDLLNYAAGMLAAADNASMNVA